MVVRKGEKVVLRGEIVFRTSGKVFLRGEKIVLRGENAGKTTIFTVDNLQITVRIFSKMVLSLLNTILKKENNSLYVSENE